MSEDKKEQIKSELREVYKKYEHNEFYAALESYGKELRLLSNKGISNKMEKWARILK